MNIKMFQGNNLPNELLLTTWQKANLKKAFENNMSTDIKHFKTQIPKIIQSSIFLGSLLCKIAGLLMKVAVPFAKNILTSLVITVASTIDAGIQKKIYGSGTTTIIISNEEINDIMKIVQALKNSNIFLKRITKTIENQTKDQKGGHSGMLLSTLVASLLGNMLAGKGTVSRILK